MKPLAPASSLLFPLPPTPRPLSSPHPNVFPVLLPFRSASPPPPPTQPSFPLISLSSALHCFSQLSSLVQSPLLTADAISKSGTASIVTIGAQSASSCPASCHYCHPPPPPPHLSPSLSAPMTQILNQQTTLDCVGAANSNIDISSWRLEKLEAVMSCTCAWQCYQ